jgi:hypothetical protein
MSEPRRFTSRHSAARRRITPAARSWLSCRMARTTAATTGLGVVDPPVTQSRASAQNRRSPADQYRRRSSPASAVVTMQYAAEHIRTAGQIRGPSASTLAQIFRRPIRRQYRWSFRGEMAHTARFRTHDLRLPAVVLRHIAVARPQKPGRSAHLSPNGGIGIVSAMGAIVNKEHRITERWLNQDRRDNTLLRPQRIFLSMAARDNCPVAIVTDAYSQILSSRCGRGGRDRRAGVPHERHRCRPEDGEEIASTPWS